MKVEVYTAPEDPNSDEMKEFLESRGVNYEEKCVVTQPELFDELVGRTGQGSVPACIVEGDIFVGFDSRVKRRLTQALDKNR